VQVNNSPFKSQLLDLETRLFGLPLEELWNLTAYDTRVHRMRQVLEDRYAEAGLSILDIARDCGMTVSNLNRIMGSLTGRTGYQLLISFRIHRSIIEALEINSSFAEIAVHNGFDNSASYSRTVRRVLGCSPSKLIRRGAGFRRELNMHALGDKERSVKSSSKAVNRLEKADLI
jgi:AraC-like DNA-binding protein